MCIKKAVLYCIDFLFIIIKIALLFVLFCCSGNKVIDEFEPNNNFLTHWDYFSVLCWKAKREKDVAVSEKWQMECIVHQHFLRMLKLVKMC